MIGFYRLNLKFKDSKLIDASLYTRPTLYIYIAICILADEFILWQAEFSSYSSSTAVLAKSKADITKKSSYPYSSRWFQTFELRLLVQIGQISCEVFFEVFLVALTSQIWSLFIDPWSMVFHNSVIFFQSFFYKKLSLS